MEDYIKNNYEVFDRFTFDHLYRNLLADGYDYEEAKDIILHNCALGALVLQERIYNEYYYRISVDEEISEDLIEFMNEIAKKIMISKGKEYERFCDYLSDKRTNVPNQFQNDQKLVMENGFSDHINNFCKNRIYNGKVGKIQTIYGQLQQSLGVKGEPAPDEWDRGYNVDFFIKVKNRYIGLQIKPAGYAYITQIINELKFQKKTHEKFTAKYGGKVFYVISVKEGKKKIIHNPEVIEEIRTEIEKLEKE